jgi:hypothetical protein
MTAGSACRLWRPLQEAEGRQLRAKYQRMAKEQAVRKEARGWTEPHRQGLGTAQRHQRSPGGPVQQLQQGLRLAARNQE